MIFELGDLLRKSGRLVFNLDQLSILSGIPRQQVKVYASRLVKKGIARRVRRGWLSLTEDPFILAAQLVEPSYISFLPSLYLLGLVDEVPTIAECVTTRAPWKSRELGVVYRKVRTELFFGYRYLRRQESYVWVATPEKAILDMVYFNMLPPKLGFDLDWRRMEEMCGMYKKVGGYRARRVIEWVKHARRE
ncbi:MAG: hypothetical protein QXH26_05465 [Candidatus Hadarchaeales archaeon]